MSTSTLYFAYGSNLLPARMRERVPSAAPRGVARLAGFRLTLDKRGIDGSGKANVVRAPGGLVWGAVYALHVDHWPLLDRFERGYERVAAEVELEGGERLGVETYRSVRSTPGLAAFEWYKRFIVDGARAHGLPDDWVALLEGLPSRP